MRDIEYLGVRFSLSDATEEPSFFVLGVRKSGSSILNSMVGALAKRLNKPYLDVAGLLFKQGVRTSEWQNDPGIARILSGGNVYGGFRDFPTALAAHPKFRASAKVLLVRDPRDALVSEYFSNAYSHSLPTSGGARDQLLDLREQALAASIETYVMERSQAMLTTLCEYRVLADDPQTRVFRYEDVITRKPDLLRSISAHFGWPVDEGHLALMMQWADVLPAEERPTQFVRRVLPGDHRNKLGPAAVERLNRIFAEPMRVFGYAM